MGDKVDKTERMRQAVDDYLRGEEQANEQAENEKKELLYEKERKKEKQERTRREIHVQKYFSEYKKHHDGESDKFAAMKIKKGLAMFNASGDALALMQSIARIDSTDPDVLEVLRLAERIAREYSELAHRDTFDSIAKLRGGSYKGGKTFEIKAAKKKERWIDEYWKVKKDHPTWKKGVTWDEVAARLEDTPYKGSAPYMQYMIKNPPEK